MKKNNDYAIVVYDQNKKIDDKIFHLHTNLVSEGSEFSGGSKASEKSYNFKTDRILDLYLANSKNSLGIKVADFLAGATFQFQKLTFKNQDGEIFWKTTLLDSLDKDKNGNFMGWGLKYIPSKKS